MSHKVTLISFLVFSFSKIKQCKYIELQESIGFDHQQPKHADCL